MKLTYQELENNSGGSFLVKAVNSAKGAVCDSYHTYKDWYHSNIDLAAPAGLLVEQVWDNLCPLEPPYQSPPPPSPPFNGGQCVNVLYHLSMDALQERGVLAQGLGFINIPGPIHSIKPISRPSEGGTEGDIKITYGSTSQTKRFTNCNNGGSPTFCGFTKVQNIQISRADGLADNCGNLPTITPPPLAPPKRINRDITIDNKGVPLTIPFSFNPQFNLPGLSINGNFAYFNPSFNFNLAPQFNIAPSAKLDFKPDINLNFDLDGVNLNIGGSQDNDTVNNFNNNNNINNINNNTSNTNNNVNNINNTVNNIDNKIDDTNDDVTIIKDKLACNPCDILEEIKEKLFYVPTYTPHFVPEFQSVKLDNLANLGYIEIDVTVFPNKTKVIYGGNAPNVLFSGWITWRKNGYNFSREQVTAQSSIYYAPKGSNGFSICCTHNSRASCLYYIEIKD
jgi:hypothetical protein